MSRLQLPSFPSTNTLTDNSLSNNTTQPLADETPFRNQRPVRMTGWMSTKNSRLSRKHHRFAKLHGEVLSLHHSENRLPEEQFDVVGALVEYSEDGTRRSFRLTVGRRVLLCILGSHEEMLSWARGLAFAAHHCFERYYTLGPLLAEGAYSRVYHASAVDDPTQVFAVKVIKKRPHDLQAQECVRRERHVNCVLNHPAVVQAVDMFSTMEKDHLVFELMRGGTLADLLAKKHALGESYARAIMRQLLSALHYIHSKNIVHRDVRPQNVFLSATKFPMSVALGDFGYSNFVSDKRVNMDVLTTMVGIPPYMAIEICRRKKYGPLADVWSAGVVLYEMLSGEVPFQGRTDSEMFQNIKKGHVSFDSAAWKKVSAEAKALIRQMLQEDAYKRVSALAALQHSWFTGGGGSMSRPSSSVNTSCPTSPTAVGRMFGDRDSPATTSTESRRQQPSCGSMSTNLSRNTSETTVGDHSEGSERATGRLGPQMMMHAHSHQQLQQHMSVGGRLQHISSVSSVGTAWAQPSLRVNKSVRDMAERGLVRVASDNPALLRHMMGLKHIQRQLSIAMPYRRRLVVTAKAFVAVFRMCALARGDSATKRLMLMEMAGADDVNAMVDRRKLAHKQSRTALPDRDDAGAAAPAVAAASG
ncbi:unnamed protein product, partial [Agarophyton chilense]